MDNDSANRQDDDEEEWSRREKVRLILLAILGCFFAMHYYPGQIARSIRETIGNLLWFSGFSIILTWPLAKALAKLEKQKPSRCRMAKVFLVLAIVFGTMHQMEGCRNHTSVSAPENAIRR
ncbi:MAG: hypothetical protein V1736_10985 [Pseudomonadota bacterium]